MANGRTISQGEKGAAWISDFTLHSIGVLLFRQKRPALFDQFAADTLPQFSEVPYGQLP